MRVRVLKCSFAHNMSLSTLLIISCQDVNNALLKSTHLHMPVYAYQSLNAQQQNAQGIKRAVQEVGELDGVTTFCELAVPLAVRIAEKLGLPHNTPDSIDYARDKVCVCVMRKFYLLVRLSLDPCLLILLHEAKEG